MHSFMVLLESQIVLKTGDTAPDFELRGVDGNMHSTSQYKKEGLLVIFMCNHCPYVKAKVDALNEIYVAYGDRIDMVGINSNDAATYTEDSYENMKSMAQEKGFGFDYLVDESQEVAKRYGAMCTPDPYLFDSSHRLVFHGRIDDAHGPDKQPTAKTMMDNIGLMLAGSVIPKDFDPSIGCSIKWKQN